VEHPVWRDLSGALLAMAIWMASYGLRYYADITIQGKGSVYTGSPHRSSSYWLYVTAMAVLLGADLNAEIEKLWPHEGQPDPAAPT
jgi:membrane protein